MENQFTVTLEGGRPWGFTLKGGADFRSPLRVGKVTMGGRAQRAGLVAGDYIMAINAQPSEGLKHLQAQQVVIKSALTLVLQCSKQGPGLVSPARKSPPVTFPHTPLSNGSPHKLPTPSSFPRARARAYTLTKPAPPPVRRARPRSYSGSFTKPTPPPRVSSRSSEVPKSPEQKLEKQPEKLDRQPEQPQQKSIEQLKQKLEKQPEKLDRQAEQPEQKSIEQPEQKLEKQPEELDRQPEQPEQKSIEQPKQKLEKQPETLDRQPEQPEQISIEQPEQKLIEQPEQNLNGQPEQNVIAPEVEVHDVRFDKMESHVLNLSLPLESGGRREGSLERDDESPCVVVNEEWEIVELPPPDEFQQFAASISPDLNQVSTLPAEADQESQPEPEPEPAETGMEERGEPAVVDETRGIEEGGEPAVVDETGGIEEGGEPAVVDETRGIEEGGEEGEEVVEPEPPVVEVPVPSEPEPAVSMEMEQENEAIDSREEVEEAPPLEPTPQSPQPTPQSPQPDPQDLEAMSTKGPGWYKQMFQNFTSTVEELFPGASTDGESGAKQRRKSSGTDYSYDHRGLRVRSSSTSKMEEAPGGESQLEAIKKEEKAGRPKSAHVTAPTVTTEDVLSASRKPTSFKANHHEITERNDESRDYWKQKDIEHQEWDRQRKNSWEHTGHISPTHYSTEMMHPLLRDGEEEGPPPREGVPEGESVLSRIDASKLHGAMQNAAQLHTLEQEGIPSTMLPLVAQTEQQQQPQHKKRTKFPPPGEKARALYNFDAQSPKELLFKKGDIIDLLHTVDENWLEGSLDGRKGIFPTSYVKVLTAEQVQQMYAPPEEPPLEQARALYDFASQGRRELSFERDDILLISRKVDDNWFEGYRGDVKGIFPIAYVEVLDEGSQ